MNPIGFRRMDWFRFSPGSQFPWRDILNLRDGLDHAQAALVRHVHTGDL